MTDGCGFINKVALKELRELLQWDTVPTAIQCRIAGAKVTAHRLVVGKVK
jgi:RNA-dependent RNA polymerase